MNIKFFQRWLDIVCREINGCDSAIFVVSSKELNAVKLVAKWPHQLQEFNKLVGVVKQTFKKNKSLCISKPRSATEPGFNFISFPVLIGSGFSGVLALSVTSFTDASKKDILNHVRRSVGWLGLESYCSGVDDNFYYDVVDLLASCFEQKSYQLALLNMVSLLCAKFKCDRVAFGDYYHQHSRVLVLSGSIEFDRRSNLVQLLGDAMNEAIEQDTVIFYPQPQSRLIYRAHEALARKYGSHSIVTFPLVNDEQYFGVVTLLCSENNEMDNKAVNLCQQFLGLVTPFLAEKREQEKNIVFKLAQSCREQLKAVFGLKFLKLKIITTLLAAFLISTNMMEDEYRVSADAVLEGKVQRVIAAPISGYLLSASVRAGDTVKKDEEMATLNDTDLRLEQAKLDGQLQKLQREYRQAQSGRDLVKIGVIKEQIFQAKAELDLNAEQIAKTRLVAPFDGVVIEGDLHNKLGTPIERGDALFKIAPLTGYRIILKVNESEISRIKEGQQGTLVLSSLPDAKLELTVEKITAVAKAENGDNIFRVEASLQNPPELLRPGMQGLGKIETGTASLLWIWTHTLKDDFTLWLWSWLP